jgi:hypothetical protein
MAGGFDAHVAPQTAGWWHGLTGSLSAGEIALALGAALLVWFLGRWVPVHSFFWMGAGLLPLIPAATGFGTPLLFFSGFTMVLVFAIVLGYAIRDWVGGLTRHPGAVVAIAFAFFILVGRFLPGPAGPQGDEPHYLLIAESLLKDGDVDLQNQFETRAFTKFTAANLDPHTAPRSPRGRMYAIHTPGLSALIAPGYTLAGYAGARAVVSALLALTVGLIFVTSRSMFGAPTAAFVFVLATFASPLPIYANALFPDSVAALPVAATLAGLVSRHPAILGLASITIAFLPWLHPRFVPLAFLLALAISMREGWSTRRAVAVFTPLLVSLGLLLFHFQSLFGHASLSAAYGPGFASDVSVFRIPWGAAGLLLDRQFGLLLFSPVLLAGVPGFVALWNRHRLMASLAAASVLGLLATGGAFSMWWGGASAPARFLIAATPALLLAAAACWHSGEARPERRTLLGATSGFGAGVLLLACIAPRALHNRADSESGLLRLLAPSLDMDRFFPGLVKEPSGIGLMIALLWGAVVVAALVRLKWGGVLLALPVVAATAGSSRPMLDPFSASLRLLESWSDSRQALGGVDERTAFSLDLPLGEARFELTPGVRLYSPRFSLPAGAWTLSVESQSEERPDVRNVARVSLVGDDESAPPFAAVTLKVDEDVATEHFRLDRHARRLHLLGEGLQSQTLVIRVRLTPRDR